MLAGAPDTYLKGAYADFLLDERHAEVAALLKNELRADALLLRLALAEQKLRRPSASGHVEALKARFSRAACAATAFIAAKKPVSRCTC